MRTCLSLALAAATVTVTGLFPGAAAMASTAPSPAPPPVSVPLTRQLSANTKFYVDPDSDAAKQAFTDLKKHDRRGALAMAKLASWPQAQWFTGGTATQVAASVSKLVRASSHRRRVPVLVAYNIPLRDCGQYSSGGAQSDADYRAWIDGFTSALGDGKSVVILEPDGLANLPSDCSATSDPTGQLSTNRLADLNYAVTRLETKPGVSVYLDAGNSSWLSVGVAADRLIRAGVSRTQGFALNVSNYLPTSQADHYGSWVSKCIWFATAGPAWAAGHTDYCASQYYSPAAPNDGAPGNAVVATDESTWHWTDAWFDQNLGATPAQDALTHFVVDTSRNGQGAWTAPVGKYTDPQVWCNAPGRGIGARPTAGTGVPLVDAYLFVKTIGQSDGQCTRGTAGPGDPEYGNTLDPAAGKWWPQQALSLVKNASPALTFNR